MKKINAFLMTSVLWVMGISSAFAQQPVQESLCDAGETLAQTYSQYEVQWAPALAVEWEWKIDAHWCETNDRKKVIYISSLDTNSISTLDAAVFDSYIKQNFGLFYPDQATLNDPRNAELKKQFAAYPASAWEAPSSSIKKVVFRNVKLPADSSYLFFGFRSPIEFENTVDTSNVTNMEGMFAYARHFNGDLSAFNTSKVTNMSSMFKGAKTFNQPLSFNTSEVTDMSRMFEEAEAFNQPVNFNTGNVTDMMAMFADAKAFNSVFGGDFVTSKVTNMGYMFAGTEVFNQDLNFDTAKVTNMDGMFLSALAFDKPLNFDFSSLQSAVGFLANKFIPSNAEYLKKLLPLFTQALGADAENKEIINEIATWLEGDAGVDALPDAIKNSPFAAFYQRTILVLREKMKQGDVGVPYSIENYDNLLKKIAETLKNSNVTMHVQSNFCESEAEHTTLEGKMKLFDNGIWCLKNKGWEVSHIETTVKNGDVMFKEFAKFDTADNRITPDASGKLAKPTIKSGNDNDIFEIKEVDGDWQIVIKDASKFKHADKKYTLVVEVVDPTDPKNKKEATFIIIPLEKPVERVVGAGGGGWSSAVVTPIANDKIATPITTTPIIEKPKTETIIEQPKEQEKKEVKYASADIYNSTIKDGQCYTRRDISSIFDSETLKTSDEFKKALAFLSAYEMTKFNNVDGYDPYRMFTRQEAAKIFSNFAINVLCRKPDLNLHTNYEDVANADTTLKPYIELAYQLGVMKGHGKGDGKFRPLEQISKAEVNAVLIRMILKSYLDETGGVWHSGYDKVSSDLQIVREGTNYESLSRNDLALMLFRAYKNQDFSWMNVDYFSYVLDKRGEFVK